MKRLGLLTAALLLLLALALPAASQARNLHFGINANTAAWGEPAEEQENVIATGAHRIREDLSWADIEPSTGEMEWADSDELYEDAAEREITILPVLGGPPCWAVPEETSPGDCWQTYPESDGEFAYFVARVAERYGPGGDFWEENPELDGDLASTHFEIWNEPYYPEFTNNEVDPERYAALYKAAVIAGREANPASRYLIESTVDATLDTEPTTWSHWAEDIVAAEPTIGEYIDAIAVHPYPGSHGISYEPENGTDAAFVNTKINYERWLEEGVNKPVWITEIGYSSCDDEGDRCVPGESQAAREEQKAEWLTDVFDALGEDEYAFVHAVYLYNLRLWEDPEKPNGNFSTWLGILDWNWEPLPAWSSYATAVEEYDGVPVPNTYITSVDVEASNAEFSFGVNDETSTLECKLDEGSWTTCTSPKKYTGVSTGTHEFAVRATNAEATESNPADVGWGTQAPATVADDSSTGTLAWTNVGNAKSGDNFYAVAEKSGAGTATAHYLKATNFGYAVPPGETILGIEAVIERSEAGNKSGEVKDSRVRIVKGGSILASEDKSAGVHWPSSDSFEPFGNSDDLWGNSWTPSDINSSGFGVAFSPTVTAVGGGSYRKAQIDEIAMLVVWD